jgi:HlyD family secretion protein
MMAGSKYVRWIIGTAALATLAVVLWFATQPPPLTVQGEVSADRVDISPRVAGRIAKLGAMSAIPYRVAR